MIAYERKKGDLYEGRGMKTKMWNRVRNTLRNKKHYSSMWLT